ncbi:MAG: hypothetical protein IPO09_15345 [Anaeromyxobacter sp.]|nr:hypothetical protein [Anaeromyxobacter sp.]
MNTSFNVRGEPPVESPLDAWRCFMRTGMDALVLGDYRWRVRGSRRFTDDAAGRATRALD